MYGLPAALVVQLLVGGFEPLDAILVHDDARPVHLHRPVPLATAVCQATRFHVKTKDSTAFPQAHPSHEQLHCARF